MHIALFGGRFDPPHIGHLQIARHTLEVLPNIDEVWYVPANTHPWRPIAASGEDRLAMLRLMDTEKIKVSDIDIQRGGETFSIDTVRELQNTTTNSYIFICGADQIKSFADWKEYRELEKRIKFLVFPRKGYPSTDNLPGNFQWLPDSHYLPTHYSSTEIRDRIKQGMPISGLVTKEVEKYILEKNLYR